GGRVLLIVAFGQERRRVVLAKDRNVSTTGHGAIERRHAAVRERSVIGAGGEVNVLAALVAHEDAGVAYAVWGLMGLASLERIEEYCSCPRRHRFTVHDPRAIRRPVGGRRLAEGDPVRVHLDGLA